VFAFMIARVCEMEFTKRKLQIKCPLLFLRLHGSYIKTFLVFKLRRGTMFIVF
jgi:hypothetical protein